MPVMNVGQSNPAPVFHARGLSKTYVMGEVEVHALRDVNCPPRRHLECLRG